MSRGRCLLACYMVVAGLAAGARAARADCTVAAPPAALHVDAFYGKYCSASGLAVLASSRVPDEALVQASRIMSALLAPLPEIRAAMIARHLYVMVLGASERTTGLYAATDAREYWAEGMQDYFGVHQQKNPSDINTRAQLAAYDPVLYALLDEKLHDVRLPDMCPRPTFSSIAWYRLQSVGRGTGVALDDTSIRTAERVSGQYWRLADNHDGTFRLTNLHHGPRTSLDVANDGVFQPQLAGTGFYSGQYWTITPITTGQYRLVSLFRPGQSLAAGTDRAQLAATADAAEQAWTFTVIEPLWR